MTSTLLVSDWVTDAEEVADAVARTIPLGEVSILVPAFLHGLDWVGDPRASVPCAARHEQALTAACRARGLGVTSAAVGDPDPVTAVLDALAAHRSDRLLLAREPRRIGWLPWLRLDRRLGRACSVSVELVQLRRAHSRREQHCAAEPSLAV